jgi:hypothetical protein
MTKTRIRNRQELINDYMSSDYYSDLQYNTAIVDITNSIRINKSNPDNYATLYTISLDAFDFILDFTIDKVNKKELKKMIDNYDLDGMHDSAYQYGSRMVSEYTSDLINCLNIKDVYYDVETFIQDNENNTELKDFRLDNVVTYVLCELYVEHFTNIVNSFNEYLENLTH